MKGQLQVSFQWIFTLLAGGVFLIMFFLLIRGCSQAGDERVEGIGVQAAARVIERAAWRPEGIEDVQVRPVTVRCPAGALTLTTDLTSARINAPVALPPDLSGRLRLGTRNIMLEGDGPAVPLGTVGYGIDENTYYLVIVSNEGGYEPLLALGPHNSIREIPSTNINKPSNVSTLIPITAKTVVVVAEKNKGFVANLDYSDVAEGRLLGVYIGEKTVTFYEWKAGAMVEIVTLPAEHEALALAAAVAGDPGSYKCVRANLERRMHYLTDIYEARARVIRDSSSDGCYRTFDQGITILEDINSKSGDAYYASLLTNALPDLQRSLLTQACEAIA